MKTSILKIIALALLLVAAPSAALAKSPKSQFQCDLTVYEDRVLTSKVQIGQVSGGWDYTGRRWWMDIALFPVCVVGLGLAIIPGLECFDYEYSRAWGGALRSPKSPESWYKATKRAAIQKCNDFIRDHAPEDIIFQDGDYLLARHYECGTPYVQDNGNNNEVIVDIFRGEPAYPNSSPEVLLQKKCQKLSTCLAETTQPDQVQWVNDMQMQLGCP